MQQDSNKPELVELGSSSQAEDRCCPSPIQHEVAVADRYSQAANEREAALCCPVSYRPEYLEAIPEEIIERDYGCGDPSPYIKSGETVVDLGSGGGKLCYIAAQVVGPQGKVIGVDCNHDMLELARKYQQQVAEKIGHDVVSFRCGVIQNLALDLEAYDQQVSQLDSTGVANILDRRRLEQRLQQDTPMIPDATVDCVVSNCVLNLVRPEDRRQLFQEIHRVLKIGGRAVISDIVSDEEVPQEMQNDPELWSGCISGAWREDQFLREFEQAGFQGLQLAKRESDPWQTVNGIEFRSVTVIAYKLDSGPCLERHQALVYKGPFKKVVTDDGQVFLRGERMAVCDKTYQAAGRQPFADAFYQVQPGIDIPLEEAQLFDCTVTSIRDAKESKSGTPSPTSSACCDPQGGCC